MTPIYLTRGNQRFDLAVGERGPLSPIGLSIGGHETVLKIGDHTSRIGDLKLHQQIYVSKLNLGISEWNSGAFVLGATHDCSPIFLSPVDYNGDLMLGGDRVGSDIIIDEIPTSRRRLRMLSEMDDFMLSDLDDWTLRGLDIVILDAE